ncbi:unnamed protein product, partial [Linum tenue]
SRSSNNRGGVLVQLIPEVASPQNAFRRFKSARWRRRIYNTAGRAAITFSFVLRKLEGAYINPHSSGRALLGFDRQELVAEDSGWYLSNGQCKGSLTFLLLTLLISPSSLVATAEAQDHFELKTCNSESAREFVRVTRKSDPDDLLNSAIAGFSTGALLGRFQAGQLGAIRYSFIFAVAGTSVDFATIKLRPKLKSLKESIFGSEENKDGGWKLPEWFPIQVLDEEALAKKEAREKQLHAQRAALAKLTKGES